MNQMDAQKLGGLVADLPKSEHSPNKVSSNHPQRLAHLSCVESATYAFRHLRYSIYLSLRHGLCLLEIVKTWRTSFPEKLSSDCVGE
jgi:hypothetical protein